MRCRRGSYYSREVVHKRTLDQLRQAGDLRRESEELRRRASAITDKEVSRAAKAGMPVAQIAELTGLSRRHVYNVLRRDG